MKDRPGEFDENGDLVTFHHRSYVVVDALALLGVCVDDLLCLGNFRSVRHALEKIREIWKTTPIEVLTSESELQFLGTWISMKVIDGQEGFFIHQVPFAEQTVKRVSQESSLKRRDTPGEPVSFGSRSTATTAPEPKCAETFPRPTQASAETFTSESSAQCPTSTNKRSELRRRLRKCRQQK